MGVHGLWKLLDSSGKPVPLETLENKVLAVDVSIWLHQVVKGFQDSQGNPLPNAHLLGLFHRICKLLFYKIKPVFVFDGGVPHLKKQTVIARQQQKGKAELEAQKIREQLLKNLIKHAAVKRVLGNSSKSIDVSALQQKRETDIFQLPAQDKLEDSFSGSDDDDDDDVVTSHKNWSTVDLHTIDVKSTQFKSLPADVRHDILSELKETRKQNSWGRLHEMPKESSDFSNYQMSRLLKRRSIQVSLEDAQQEMGGHSLSLGELEELLNEQGVVKTQDDGRRIASDSTTRYIYIKDIGNQILRTKLLNNSTDESTSQTKEEGKPVEEVTHIESEVHEKEDYVEEKQDYVKEKDCVEEEEDYVKDILSFIPEDEEEENTDLSFNSDTECYVKRKFDNTEDINLKIAEDFMFENSGLTQQQILAVIQHQNVTDGDTQHIKANVFSLDQPSTSRLSEIKNLEGEKEVENCPVSATEENNCKSISDSNLNKLHHIAGKCSELADSAGNSIAEDNSDLLLSNICNSKNISNLNNKNRNKIDKSQVPCNIENDENTQGKTNIGSESIKKLESFYVESEENEVVDLREVQETSSDTDESFVEVDGRDSSLFHKNGKENSLQVTIQRDKACTLEDDIFADIFVKNSGKEPITLKPNKHTTNANTSQTKIAEDKEIKSDDVTNSGNQSINSFEDAAPVNRKGKNIEEEEENKLEIHNAKHKKEETTSEHQVESAKKDVPTEELQQFQATILDECRDLMAQQGKQERLAANITDQMCLEAQELLQLFGVPFIIAPMEAEAQCAFLDFISLTDGTITDDSDIWLFGGQKVYKNFFNQKKHVLQFQASDIKHYFNLERQQLIMIALLVGSDYTPGIQGVGPVTALEILAAFPSTENALSGLQKFRDWLNGGMKVGPGKTPLKNKLKSVQFTEGFPNQAVVDAYLNPKVDESKETFSWAFPDLESLRDFTKRKFGWTRSKADEILLPVMKKQEERKSQRSLDSYFKIIPHLHAADGKLSKRVQQAVQRIGRVTDSDDDMESTQPKRKCIKPKSAKPKCSTVKERGKKGGKCVTLKIDQEQHKETMPSSSREFIPQRERDKINTLKSKLRAIEVFRTSKIDKCNKKLKKTKRQVLKEAKLSESSSDSG